MFNEHLSIKACKALAGRAREQGLRCSVKEWWYVNEGAVGKAPLLTIKGCCLEAPAFTVLEAMEILVRLDGSIDIGPNNRLVDGNVGWYWQECDDPDWQGPFYSPVEAMEDALTDMGITEASDE
jgi:hypothetical protein